MADAEAHKSGSPQPQAGHPVGPQQNNIKLAVRVIVSCGLFLHIIAIAVAPTSIAPSSQVEQEAWRFFRPYLQFLHINNGYRFFAPEPAASTLFTFRLGAAQPDVKLPKKGLQPRLLYHRELMLCDFTNRLSPEHRALVVKAYAQHVLTEESADEVAVSRTLHLLPSRQAVQEGATLTDPESYLEEPLGRFRSDSKGAD